MHLHPTSPAFFTQAPIDIDFAPVAERRRRRARAYRDGELICGRVELTIRPDGRLGLAPRERRQLAARFVERLAPGFRDELEQLIRRPGAAVARIGDETAAIELVFDDSQRLVGRLEPPRSRRGELCENEFVIREYL